MYNHSISFVKFWIQLNTIEFAEESEILNRVNKILQLRCSTTYIVHVYQYKKWGAINTWSMKLKISMFKI